MIRKILLLLGLSVLVSNLGATVHERVTINCNGVTSTHEGEIVLTNGNQVGIASNDVCVYDSANNAIVCKSGKVFRNPNRYEYHSGTLEQGVEGQFIGKIVRRPTPGMMGSGGYTAFAAWSSLAEMCSPQGAQVSDVILPAGMGILDTPPVAIDPNPFRR